MLKGISREVAKVLSGIPDTALWEFHFRPGIVLVLWRWTGIVLSLLWRQTGLGHHIRQVYWGTWKKWMAGNQTHNNVGRKASLKRCFVLILLLKKASSCERRSVRCQFRRKEVPERATKIHFTLPVESFFPSTKQALLPSWFCYHISLCACKGPVLGPSWAYTRLEVQNQNHFCLPQVWQPCQACCEMLISECNMCSCRNG